MDFVQVCDDASLFIGVPGFFALLLAVTFWYVCNEYLSFAVGLAVG